MMIKSCVLVFLAFLSVSALANDTNDVTKYGAIPNDGVDDTAAFKAAIAGAESHLYVPAGEFNLSSRLDFTGEITSIVGDGAGLSKMVWESGVSGIYVKPPAGINPVHLKGITLLSKSSNAANAYWYDGSNSINENYIQPRGQGKIVIDDVLIKGYNGAQNHGWKNGLIIDSSLGAVINNFNFLGKTNSDFSSFSDSAILMRGSGDPVIVTISDARIFYANFAVQTVSHEGVFIDQSNFVAVNYGVYTNNSSIQPQLNVSNSHIACRKICIWAKEANQVNVNNNLIYTREQTSGNVIGVLLTEGSFSFNISGNSFVNHSSDDFNMVVAQSDYGIISNNIFNNKNRGTAVWLKSTSSNVNGSNNICYNCGTPVLNQGKASNIVEFSN
ncbi:hypothetical protein ACJJIR_10595 [Microbulbifer sp. SSSA008]|uniref:hypothetical protein n=1 Tax=Microbulbifer sp. SSSA008 TaxID=3243380 RepID=UPI00403A3CAF